MQFRFFLATPARASNGRNFHETVGESAAIRIHTGTATPSRLMLFVLPAA